MQIQAWEGDGLSLSTPGDERHMKFDGKDYPVRGMRVPAGVTSSAVRPSARSPQVTDKLWGKVTQTEQAEVSSDLRMFTLTMHPVGQSMQLDPYFLFNALNTSSSQVERDPRLARTMMAFLDHYVAIQKIRFGSSLRIETQVGADVKHALVPCLIVQPLVENAIRHGISRRASGGAVMITANRNGERLVMRILDGGVRLPPDWTPENPKGLGLSITRQRIQLLHPGGNSHFDARPRGEVTRRWKFLCRCGWPGHRAIGPRSYK